MSFDIDVDRSGTNITPVEPPHFLLNQRQHVQRMPHGSVRISYAQDGGGKFGPDEWRNLIAANGDIDVLGFGAVNESPVVESLDPAPPISYPAVPVN